MTIKTPLPSMKISRATNGRTMAYTYDLVGNVTQVASTYPWLPNQSFIENFNYDSADQLTTAQENQNNGYQLAVNYGNWGKIMQYDIAQTDMLSNATETHSRNYSYPAANYAVAQTSFAPITQAGDEQINLTYGINGSLRKKEVTQPQQNTEYYLFNSQGNLKAYSDDIMDFAYYGYNAANTRTYKLSLYNTNIWINGQQEPLNMQLQQAMFYPNTYLNFNGNGEYTKHYYNGTERIASRLGDNSVFIGFDCNDILESHRVQLEEKFREELQDLIFETVPIDLPPVIDVNTLQPTGTPNDIYYYHINHLGSTSFVTDGNATITQGFLYAPFGEITTEYNINFGNNVIPKYSFNAKELDEETGMYYYEARYYAPPTFTSRDPMFEKYFWMTPYAYCANNPVKYVDPDGKEIGIPPFGIGTSIVTGIVIDGLIYKQKAMRSTMTISNNYQAVRHYYWGGGSKVNLDPKFATTLMNTQKFKEMHQKIKLGKNLDNMGNVRISGSFSVDMTNEEDAFFIGRTAVNYKVTTSKDKKTCTVTYTLFMKENEPDDFSDPNFLFEQKNNDDNSKMRIKGDGMGPNLELGGKPYKFKSQQRSFTFDNPGVYE